MAVDASCCLNDSPMLMSGNQALRDHYLSHLQRTPARYELEVDTSYIPIHAFLAHPVLHPAVGAAQKILRKRQLDLVRVWPPGVGTRDRGRAWPQSAETIGGMNRLDNLRECLVQVFTDHSPGDVLEAGVWRGGARASSCAGCCWPTLRPIASHGWSTPSLACPNPNPAGTHPAQARCSTCLTN